MKKQHQELLFSPSDLARYVQSPFASWMARLCIEQPEFKQLKDKPVPLLSYLAEKGLAHEANYLAELTAGVMRALKLNLREFRVINRSDKRSHEKESL